ncbi:glycosyltransferase family 4 protein [Ekhidna sp.]|uniref:glycosyltransferase family 4 protein n=1 Tax=Ekhidna sp. TaxID=2608089 RepID=UPI003CCC2D66
MRIGIEAQRIFRKKKHGMDIYALQLLRHLQKEDLDNEYFVFVKKGEDVCLEETENFTIVEVGGLTYADWEQIHLPRAASKYNLDVLHCTSNTAPLFSGIPLVLTLHDIIYLNKSFSGGSLYQRLGHYYRKWIVPIVYKKAKKVLTVSNFEKEAIKNHFGRNRKVSVIYNGVDKKFDIGLDPKFLKKVRKELGLPDHYFFFLGNTAPKKNMKGMLEAYAEYYHNSNNPYSLVIAESSEKEVNEMLDKIGQKEANLPIYLTGYVPHEWLPAVYRLSEAFVYPSLRESFGIPIIEAMACGAPVITSLTSSMPEVGGGAARFVDPTKPEEIAQWMRMITDEDQLRNDMVAAGMIRSTMFTWSRAADQTMEIYHSMLSQSIVLDRPLSALAS